LPRRFGDYELLAEIARGGMGVVYLARQLKAGGRKVALKMILGGEHASGRAFDDFQREALLVAGINHPGIVPIHEVGEVDSQPFYSMTLIEGGSLQQLLQSSGPLEPHVAARLVQQVAEAVQHAHDHDIIHRDIKPANILLQSAERKAQSDNREAKAGSTARTVADGCSRAVEATPRLTDFGLARTREGGHSVTGEVLGTPSYMAPEQAEGRVREIGPVTDVYGLGAVLYCALTGRPPFQSASPMETMRQVLEKEPVPLRQLNPSVPRDLETVCLKCLEKQQGRRYQSARELAEELGLFLADKGVRARPVGTLERAWRWSRRNRLVASLLVLVLVLLSAAIGVAAYSAAVARGRTRLEEGKVKLEAALEETGIAHQKAEAEKRRADGKAQEAERLRLAADAAREETERLRYFNQIQLAHREWEGVNLTRARELLETTPQKFRGWEYGYLHTLINDPQCTLHGHTGIVRIVCFSADGKRIASGSADNTVKVWDTHTGQEQLTLKGHNSAVGSVCFSPDGKRIASASFDQTVRVWDALSGQEALTLTGHTDPVYSVCFSPDGKRLASASGDRTVRLWDARTGQLALSLKGHTNGVISVCFSPDGKRLASASQDGTVKVWDATGQQTLAFKGHTGEVYSVCFSPDGKRLASAGADRTVRLWDAITGQEVRSFKGHTGQVFSVCFSPDGKRIASAGVDDRTVKLWDVQTGQQLVTLKGHTGTVWSVALSPDGKLLASAGWDKTVRVWDAANGQQRLSLQGHTAPASSVVFSADGKYLASATDDGPVKVWDAQNGQELLSLKGDPAWVTSVCLSPDGQRIASGRFDETVRVWDAQTGKQQLSLKGHGDAVLSVCFSPDSQRIASASFDKTVKVWDAQNGQEQLSLKGHTGYVWSVVFSADGRHLASGSGDHTVKVWDARSGQERLSLKGHTSGVRSVCFSPRGKHIAAGSDNGTVKVWDAATGQEALSLQGHTATVQSVCFSADGERIASASQDGTVRVWDAATGQEALSLQGYTDTFSSVCFSPDGQRLTSVSLDGILKVWDAATGQQALSLKGHTGVVQSVSFSPDGQRIASGSGGLDQKRGKSWGEVKVWDAQTGQQTLSLNGHGRPVTRVCFSPDGKRVISTDMWGYRIVWDLSSGKPLTGARAPHHPVHPVSPDGRWFAHTEGNLIRLVPILKGNERPRLRRLALPNSGWHQRQALASEVEGDWFGAAVHLGRLLQLHPWDATIQVRRAYALARGRRTDEAALAYLSAVSLFPRVPLSPLDPRAAQRGNTAAKAGTRTPDDEKLLKQLEERLKDKADDLKKIRDYYNHKDVTNKEFRDFAKDVLKDSLPMPQKRTPDDLRLLKQLEAKFKDRPDNLKKIRDYYNHNQVTSKEWQDFAKDTLKLTPMGRPKP
jgi:WD40 repeat protein